MYQLRTLMSAKIFIKGISKKYPSEDVESILAIIKSFDRKNDQFKFNATALFSNVV